MKMTKEQIDKLTELWASGESANNIAKILGTTKNVVIGKVHRLHLPKREAIIIRKVESDGNVTFISASKAKKSEESVEPFTPETTWTVKQVVKLKELLSKGLSFSKIAEFFGITKGMVSGKVHRLRMAEEKANKEKTASTEQVAEEKPFVPEEKVRLRPVVEIEEHHHKKEKVLTDEESIEETLLEESAKDNCRCHSKKGKTLFELKHNECHWPIGDPKDPDFHFCGENAVEGKPYCKKHCAFAYVKVGK